MVIKNGLPIQLFYYFNIKFILILCLTSFYMDYELLNVDFYRLRWEELIPLTNRYNIKVTNETTVRDLRPILALLKHELGKAQKDPFYEHILHSVIRLGVVHPIILNKYPDLENIKNIFIDLSEQEIEEHLNEQKQLYDQIIISKRAFKVNIPQTSSHDIQADKNLESEIKELQIKHIDTLPLQHTTTQSSTDTQVTEITQGQVGCPDKKETQATKIDKMTSEKVKIPLLNPTIYNGLPSEDVQTFIERFKLASKINNWDDALQKELLQTYLNGVAYNFYILYRKQNPNFTINEVLDELLTRFIPTSQESDLQLTISNKIQQPTETPTNYIINLEFLCKKWKPHITDTEIISFVLTGIQPKICEYLTNHEIKTMTDLYKHVQQYERLTLVRSMNATKTQTAIPLSGTDPVLSEIQDIKKSINALQLQKPQQNFQKQFTQKNTARPHNVNIRSYKPFANTTKVQHQNTTKYDQPNTFRRPSNNFNDTQRFSRPQFQNNFPKNPNNNTQNQPILRCNFCNRQGHIYQTCRIRRQGTFNNKTSNTPPLFCKICKRNNHSTQQCYYKNSKPVSKNE